MRVPTAISSVAARESALRGPAGRCAPTQGAGRARPPRGRGAGPVRRRAWRRRRRSGRVLATPIAALHRDRPVAVEHLGVPRDAVLARVVEQVGEVGAEGQRGDDGPHADRGARDARGDRDRAAAAPALQRHAHARGHRHWCAGTGAAASATVDDRWGASASAVERAGDARGAPRRPQRDRDDEQDRQADAGRRALLTLTAMPGSGSARRAVPMGVNVENRTAGTIASSAPVTREDERAQHAEQPQLAGRHAEPAQDRVVDGREGALAAQELRDDERADEREHRGREPQRDRLEVERAFRRSWSAARSSRSGGRPWGRSCPRRARTPPPDPA